MRWLIGIALVVWLAALALPQGRGDRASGSAPATPRPAAGADGPRARDAACDVLRAEHRAAVAAWRSQLREARRAGRTRPPSPDAAFHQRFADLSRSGSMPATVWCLQRTGGNGGLDAGAPLAEAERSARRELYLRLIDGLATDGRLVTANLVELLVREAARGLGREEALALSRQFELAARDDAARRAAWYAQARLLSVHDVTDEDAIGRARELYERIQRLQPDTELARDAGDELWRLDHVAVGKTAPDFVSADVFGNEIRLGDFRQRIVVAHFSRFLEPESRGSLVAFRDLAQEFWDEDFMLLGISADEDRQAFRRLIEAEDLLWTIAFEGSSAGAAAKAWRVRDWPQVFVLDGAGVVRFIGLEGRELSAAVRTLIGERER
ncbi:MAG: redoxin domain-containing protein [Planctomycetota bacterium]|nr:MAG: redoxin domain-containing protein [Planctomycetota bacterium]